MIAQTSQDSTIRADQLTEGDIIQHSVGNTWMVITEPEYTTLGITFEVLCLDVETLPNTQTVCFTPEESFLLLDHQGFVGGLGWNDGVIARVS
jgi:hypothetical protein